jgi:hypothetical protein
VTGKTILVEHGSIFFGFLGWRALRLILRAGVQYTGKQESGACQGYRRSVEKPFHFTSPRNLNNAAHTRTML